MMQSSFWETDVILLLKDITGMVKPMSTQEREKRIQSGIHYCEMLPIEYTPSDEYMRIYRQALNRNAKTIADAVAVVSQKIISKKGKDVVLVSIARAGIPIGILIKRYIKNKYKIDIPHYAISIIRGRGIDRVALNYILERHSDYNLQFVDGWTGKGAILTELKKELKDYKNISQDIAVVSDPAHIVSLYGTHEDFLIPSSCLNSTISGLISRTFLDNKIIGKDDFHGAIYYGELKKNDLTYEFIESVESNFDYNLKLYHCVEKCSCSGVHEVQNIANEFGVKDINFVKPGIGETTRVLLRRIPWLILVNDLKDTDNMHILRLAEEKKVKVEQYPLKNYRTCGIIKDLNSEL